MNRATIIVGPNEEETLDVARHMAAPYKAFEEVDVTRLSVGVSPVDTVDLMLLRQPALVIVKGFPTDERVVNWFKGAITSHHVEVRTKSGDVNFIKPPAFIFCSGDKNPIPVDQNDRRFLIINLRGDSL